MKWCPTILALVGVAALGASLLTPLAARSAAKPPESQRDLAAEVHAIFQKKCTQCHGPKVKKPKGKFGYVLDLKRLASNADLVVPSKPADSKLWEVVNEEDMPPEEARAGPLTTKEKETIRAWIAAGAPAQSGAASASAPSVGAADDEPESTPQSMPFLKRVLRWIGKFHILVIHFPIALLLAAVAGEMWSMWHRRKEPAETVRFCVLLGAAGAVVAAVLGWLHAAWGGFGASYPLILTLHRWFGTATAVWAVAVACGSEVDARRGLRSQCFRIMLFVGAMLVGIAGHLGGIMVYGEDYYDF